MRPQSRCKHITYYKPINYLVIDKILTCPTFLVHLTICNSRERHNALNFCCLAKYHSLQIDGGFLNGTESRVLLPLWKWETEGRCLTGAAERIHGESDIRNGTESRILLPLWKGETEGRCLTGAAEMVHEKYSCCNGTESRVLLPLWKWGTEGRCRTGAVERVHGESGFRNGTETWVLLPLWKGGRREDAVQGL